jgi:tRNA A-37 threonylcarbamoyl transferase component Bud32
MHPEGLGEDVTVERRERVTVYRRSDISGEEVLHALDRPGELIKASPRTETRRVGAWIVKRSRPGGFLTAIKLTLLRWQCRKAWVAGRYLERRGVEVPRVLAYIERGAAGIMTQYALVSEFLDGYVDVERYADDLIQSHASPRRVANYLAELAEAVNRLCSYQAFHRDLAGKNVLTRDGRAFYFVDLDAVAIKRTYGDRERLKNHVQLYDSFCDRWGDDVLEPFIALMLPDPAQVRRWMEAVRTEQRRRRARTQALWRKEGQL